MLIDNDENKNILISWCLLVKNGGGGKILIELIITDTLSKLILQNSGIYGKTRNTPSIKENDVWQFFWIQLLIQIHSSINKTLLKIKTPLTQKIYISTPYQNINITFLLNLWNTFHISLAQFFFSLMGFLSYVYLIISSCVYWFKPNSSFFKSFVEGIIFRTISFSQFCV